MASLWWHLPGSLLSKREEFFWEREWQSKIWKEKASQGELRSPRRSKKWSDEWSYKDRSGEWREGAATERQAQDWAAYTDEDIEAA